MLKVYKNIPDKSLSLVSSGELLPWKWHHTSLLLVEHFPFPNTFCRDAKKINNKVRNKRQTRRKK